MDIFTFKDKFEKLYLTCTQKHHLPDLLKNNYLEGLALVKGIEKIDEIWKRLVRAFGNPELLLKGKLREAEKFGPLWKIRDNQRLTQALAKLSYAMTDLSHLAKKHDIESDLHHNTSLNLIYNIISDVRKRKYY